MHGWKKIIQLKFIKQMKFNKEIFCLFIFAMIILTPHCRGGEEQKTDLIDKEMIAICLNEKGWVIYGTASCSACIAQKKVFGEAWKYITYIECDPHEENSDPDLCLKRNITKTPTWILEIDGEVVKRLESYQLPEDLNIYADCNI